MARRPTPAACSSARLVAAFFSGASITTAATPSRAAASAASLTSSGHVCPSPSRLARYGSSLPSARVTFGVIASRYASTMGHARLMYVARLLRRVKLLFDSPGHGTRYVRTVPLLTSTACWRPSSVVVTV